MTKSYSFATVTFSDGQSEKFDQVSVFDDGTLETTTRRVFNPAVPEGVSTERKSVDELGEATVTALFARHAWVSISEPPNTVLCVALVSRTWDVELRIIKNEVGRHDDVSADIRGWLTENVGSSGTFQGYFDGKNDAMNTVSDDRGRALATKYLLATAGENPERRGHVQFWLAEPTAHETSPNNFGIVG